MNQAMRKRDTDQKTNTSSKKPGIKKDCSEETMDWQNVRQSIEILIRHPPRRYVRLAVVLLGIFSLFLIYRTLHMYGFMYGDPKVERWCDYEDIPKYMLQKEPDEITIVTAFVGLGTFKKGQGFASYQTPYNYKKWMRPLGRMTNPVLAFIENDEDISYFRSVRSCLPDTHTVIIKYDRKNLWSFSLLEDIKKILGKRTYPKIHPNTVYPEYVCAMHSKYDILEKALQMDVFKTAAFAWMDISYFKKLDGTDMQLFKLLPPPKFNPEKVGYTQSWPHDPNIDLKVIMRSNLAWVSGGFILGVKETLMSYIKQYRWTVETLLKDELANTDPQVVFAMFTGAMQHRYNQKQVKIHSYTCRQGQLDLYGTDVRNYCLGFVCKNVWERIHQGG